MLESILLALATGPVMVAQQPQPSAPAFDAKELGRQCTSQFLAGQLDPIWARMGPKMREALKSKEQFAELQQKILKDMGREIEVIDEVVSPLMSYHVYMRTVKMDRWPQPVSFTWSFDEQGQIVGFYVAPKKVPVPSAFMEYKTKTPLRLPFQGAWAVVWGGRTVEQNYHAMVRDQRFAYDLLIIKDDVTHTGDGTKNEQYFAYNQPILAPGAGQVVVAVDGVPDNVPGTMNPAKAAGNHVVIAHGNGEFSLLAHLKPGTLKVKVGQAVKAGAQIGLCGNSGNSSEAHLHYHLQNSAVFGQGEGLPAQFQNYKADGKPVALGEPAQGQVVQP